MNKTVPDFSIQGKLVSIEPGKLVSKLVSIEPGYKVDRTKGLAIAIAVIALSVCLTTVCLTARDIAQTMKESAITQQAMSSGYVQEVVDGQVVWRKKGATVGEWLKWAIDTAKDFF